MINSVGANNTQVFQNLQTYKNEKSSQINEPLKQTQDVVSKNNLSELSKTIREIKGLKDDEPINFRGIFSLSGYTLDDKVRYDG